MTRTIRILVAVTLGGFGAGLGCSGADVNLGGNQNPGQTSAFAGTWTGYAEGETYQPSGSDQVRFVLDAQGNGTVQVGNDALFPTPPDPNTGFPAGSEDPHPALVGFNGDLQGGVLYPTYATQLQGDGVAGRIQFGLNPVDYYAAWCAAQTPMNIIVGCSSDTPAGTGGSPGGATGGASGSMGGQSGGSDAGLTPDYAYSILPGAPQSSLNNGDGTFTCTVTVYAADCSRSSQQVDCGKFGLATPAGTVCACTATSCTTGQTVAAGTGPAGYPAHFDGTVDASGKTLTGTLGGATVHLTRQ